MSVNVLALLTAARDAGVKVTVDGTKLVLEGDGLTDPMVDSFRANKPEILRLLKSDLPASEAPAPAPDAADLAMGSSCDDCGRPTAVALVTSYGARYCRACVFPDAAKVDKAPEVQADAQEELVR